MYMAPEQFRDRKRANPRADLFSLGCLLYELVSGVRRFQGTPRSRVESDLRSLVPGGARRGAGHPGAHRVARSPRAPTGPEPPVADLRRAPRLLVQRDRRHRRRRRLGARPPAAHPVGSAPPRDLPPRRCRSLRPVRTRTLRSPRPTAVPATQAGTVFRTVAGIVGLGWVLTTIDDGGGARGSGWGGVVPGIRCGGCRPRSGRSPSRSPGGGRASAVDPRAGCAARAQPRRGTDARGRGSGPGPGRSGAGSGGSDAGPHPVEGVRRAWLVTPSGARYKPGPVPAGSYVLQVFFEESRPTQAMTLELHAGEMRVIGCDRTFRVCK